jgi:hypothetical protein
MSKTYMRIKSNRPISMSYYLIRGSEENEPVEKCVMQSNIGAHYKVGYTGPCIGLKKSPLILKRKFRLFR